MRDLSKTAKRYFFNEMKYDLIPLIPFWYIVHFKYSRLFFLIKCVRIFKGLKLLDVAGFMRGLHSMFGRRLKYLVKNPRTANDQDNDHNGIMKIIWISIIFKVFRMLVLIAVISYYFGTFFFIFSDLTCNTYLAEKNEDEVDHFVEAYGLDQFG